MNNGNVEENEFQIYKQQLKQDVVEYLEIDDQIAALNKAIKERRKTKKKLSETILDIMKKFEIDNMNTKNGRLVYSVTKTKKPLNKDNIIKGLNQYFNDEEKAVQAATMVLQSRETVEKIKLRRVKSKRQ